MKIFSVRRAFIGIMVLLLITSLLSGCQKQYLIGVKTDPTAEPVSTDTDQQAVTPTKPASTVQNTKTKKTPATLDKKSKPADESTAPNKPSNNHKKVDPDAHTVNHTADSEKNNTVTENVYGHTVTIQPFDPKSPALMGIKIGETENSVIYMYGNAPHKYVMEDDQSPVTVYAYHGFSVGFDKNKQVTFVNILSGKLDPGLNGLHLGQTVNNAVQLLGEPTNKNDYMLKYNLTQDMVRLDIDPKTEQILSIKLFPISSSRTS